MQAGPRSFARYALGSACDLTPIVPVITFFQVVVLRIVFAWSLPLMIISG